MSGYWVSRPIDRLDFRPVGLRHTRREAMDQSCCARCGFDVNVAELADIDAREYRISALCPTCWDAIADLWPEDDPA